MPTGNTFTEIAALLSLATLVGILGQKLRQPLIIMFLAAGILAGPSLLGIIHSYEQIDLLAHIGIALLLFVVGLKLDLHLIRTIGPVALATGLGQIIFTSVVGFGIATALGLSFINAAYVAVALTFSSTIIIVKLLSDKKEIDSLHGQIAIGFLIIQDIAAVLALVALTTLGASIADPGSAYGDALFFAAKGIGFLLAIGLLIKYVLPSLTRRLAHSLELLTLFAVAWAVFLGATGEVLGFSKEVGAFLAGISLASTEYRDSIGARLTGLRDFLLLFFFIDLGARLDWSTVGAQLGHSLIFSLFVLIGNPLIVLAIMGFMGYRRRTSLLAGLTVAQISEFSLIVVALGLSLGHIDNETVGLVTLVGVVTIFTSTYMILYSSQLYAFLSEPLKLFERRNPYREDATESAGPTTRLDVVLVGLGNYGSGLARHLLRRNRKLLGVDFDPAALDRWREKGLSVLYGDMADPELTEQLPLDHARWLVSTVRSKEVNLAFVNNIRERHCCCKVALTATNEAEAQEFREAGANLVFRPFADAAEQAVDALTDTLHFVPQDTNWPIAFIEVQLRTDAAVAGKTISEIPLRTIAGVSILAITRGGQVFYDPTPDFRVFPRDRLLIMGPPEVLNDAQKMLNHFEARDWPEDEDPFKIEEVRLGANSPLDGKNLIELRFRQQYGATLIGIRRGEQQITSITPELVLQGGDCLILIGKAGVVQKLKQQEPL